MTIREATERLEESTLSPYAALSRKSRGRAVPVRDCPIRTCFQRDRDRIIHSKAFRRLQYKTQVFLAPQGDHYRTRLTHTLEVAQIARTISRALRLNEDLAEAITLGHDLGHTPFGHAGEEALNECYPKGFSHNEQSLRVVEKLDNLNLTYEVKEGIYQHSKGESSLTDLLTGDSARLSTLEAEVARLSDAIAYINHDIDDAIRAEITTLTQLPQAALKVLGQSHSQRITSMVLGVVEASRDSNKITMKQPILEATDELRTYLYQKVYTQEAIEEPKRRAKKMLKELYSLLLAKPSLMPWPVEGDDSEAIERKVVDFIAGMTDRYALALYGEFFLINP